MASRRTSTVPRSLKSTSSESKSSFKGGNVTNKANNSGNEKKSVKSSGTIVKSRYLQSAEKASLSKNDSSNNEQSMAPPPRPASPKPRPKVGSPQRRFLQSTFSDGHSSRPDFDISAIKEKTVAENAAEPDRSSEIDKIEIEQQTLLLAYMTAKMQHNTAKLRAEAETRILQGMEEKESLRVEVSEKKRQYELMEKNRLLSEVLDLQLSALAPVAEAAAHFTNEYKSFAAAVDATRHEVPVKNFYMDGEQSGFLVKAESWLKDSENLIAQCTHGNREDNCTSVESFKSLKNASKDVSKHLSGAVSELLEVSALIGQQTSRLQQASEEEQLGSAQTRLYCH